MQSEALVVRVPATFAIPSPAPVYHITDASNLESILGAAQINSRSSQLRLGITHTSIAYEAIQERRARRQVPCGPGGTLHDYVPCFFCRRSPMLHAISWGNVAGRRQGDIVYLCSTVEDIRATGRASVFTDGHGIMQVTEFFTDPARLDRVDWPLMVAKWWTDTTTDPDRKRRRQAEFLVHDFLRWEAITLVVVRNAAMRDKVAAMMAEYGDDRRRPIQAQRSWYY